LTLSAFLMIPGAYLNGRKFLNLPDIQVRLPAINPTGLSTMMVVLWGSSLVLGQMVSAGPLAAILLPILNVVAIGFPILLFLRIALQKLELPPARYGWSVFGMTLAVGPIIATLAEGVAMLIIILVVGIYARQHRELADELLRLAQAVQHTVSQDTLAASAAPVLFSPIGIMAMIGLFSVAVPAIEEATKVAALWLFASRIKDPIQGFALGVLCGAAFSLAENLGFSSSGAGDWATTAALRASSALPHMLNSGILGWSLVSAWKQHTYLKLGLGYVAVMLIHGTWNAISMAIWLNSLLPYTQNAPAFLANPTPFFFGWAVMIAGCLGGLVYNNLALRNRQLSHLRYNEPLSDSTRGEFRGFPENPD
jgi:hypothetical protein